MRRVISNVPRKDKAEKRWDSIREFRRGACTGDRVVRRELTDARADGVAVERLSLANRNGIRLDVLTYGGIITSLWVPDRAGASGDIVFGFDNPARYQNTPRRPFFG